MPSKNNKSKKFKIVGIDFFSGCGGVTYGFRNSGIEVLIGLDNDESVRESYERNNYPSKFMNVDITDQKKNLEIIKDALNSSEHDYSVFAACAPCQPFSLQNKKFETDERKSLLLNFIDNIKQLEKKFLPSFLFVENVGNMKMRGQKILKEILFKLKKMHYLYLEPMVINAANFGVPQKRKRLIFIAVNQDSVNVNLDIFSWDYFYKTYRENEKSVREAIDHLKKLEAGEADPNDLLHSARNLSPTNIKRIKQIKVPGGSRNSWDKGLTLKCHENYSGHQDVYGRMSWDKPAPTMTTKCTSISNGRFGHPEQNRAISLREAAIFQTMDNFDFGTNFIKDRIARQIGNAVPPKLAEKFGKYFQELIVK